MTDSVALLLKELRLPAFHRHYQSLWETAIEKNWSHTDYLVAVGMPLTRHPPHRSVRAVLPHTAPASGDDGETARWARGGGYAVAGARHRESV